MTTDDESLNRLFRARHLTTLQEAGLIEIEWQGTTKLHSLNANPILQLKSGWLKSLEEDPQ